MELARRNNIVPHEDVQSAMSRNLHGGGRIDTRVDELANGGASEIIGNKAPILIPRPCPRMNTSLCSATVKAFLRLAMIKMGSPRVLELLEVCQKRVDETCFHAG